MAELDAKELAAYIQKKYLDTYEREISPIKLQKSLYFLFAYWGGFVRKSKLYPEAVEESFSKYNEYLFDEEFEAWVYGPVVPTVYREKNLERFYNDKLFEGKEQLKEFVDDLLKDLFLTSDFSLVDISHSDNSWKNNFDYNDKFHDKKIDKEQIIEEYSRK